MFHCAEGFALHKELFLDKEREVSTLIDRIFGIIFGVIVYVCVFCVFVYACERITYNYNYGDDER